MPLTFCGFVVVVVNEPKLYKHKLNYKIMTKLSKNTQVPQCDKTDVIIRFSFEEREPEQGSYISLVWEDGSDCECIYDGLDKSILPLPTHWYYVK